MMPDGADSTHSSTYDHENNATIQDLKVQPWKIEDLPTESSQNQS